MKSAALLSAQGCPHGTAVVADEQTAGIGRQGHIWHSEPATGLYVSVILRLPLPPQKLPILTLALGLATREAIALTTGISCDLRWPNDLLTSGKKVAGILVQIADTAAIAGIGINVNHSTFPAWIEQEATSLRQATGHSQDRETLLTQLLRSVEDLCAILTEDGPDAILNFFTQASSFARGKRVQVDMGEARMLEGITDGLTREGYLRVRKQDGTIEQVVAGGVRPA